MLSLASWLEKKALLKSVACDANGFPNNGTVRNGNCWGVRKVSDFRNKRVQSLECRKSQRLNSIT